MFRPGDEETTRDALEYQAAKERDLRRRATQERKQARKDALLAKALAKVDEDDDGNDGERAQTTTDREKADDPGRSLADDDLPLPEFSEAALRVLEQADAAGGDLCSQSVRALAVESSAHQEASIHL